MKNSASKKWLKLRVCPIILLLLVGSMFCALAGCDSVPETQPTTTVAEGIHALNWQLHGTWISADGTTESVPFSIWGYIQDTPDDLDALYITIDLPDDFRYSIGTPTPSFVSMNQKADYFPHLMIFHGFAYDKPANSSDSTQIALDLEKEYAVITFETAPDCYLVAATAPSVDHTELLRYFSDLIKP